MKTLACAAAGLLVASIPAAADPAPNTTNDATAPAADLTLKHDLPKLKMRPKAPVVATTPKPKQTAAEDNDKSGGRPTRRAAAGGAEDNDKSGGVPTRSAAAGGAEDNDKSGGVPTRSAAAGGAEDNDKSGGRPTRSAAAGGAEDNDNTSVTFKPLPTSLRDLGERVTFKINAGVEVDTAPTSGQTILGGSQLPSGFADSRPWIVGDAMVGAKDLLLPSLGAYFLASFMADASDSLATRAATIDPSDATGQHLAIKAGYAEYGRDSKAEAAGQAFWVRAGRQFRLDGGAMFAYFDGVTGGYRKNGVEASAFVGQRVALYVDTPNGIEFGATAAADLKKTSSIPIKLAVDFLGLAINDGTINAVNGGEDQLRWMLNVTGSADPNKKLHLELRVRAVDDGQVDNAPDPVTNQLTTAGGPHLGRIGGRIRYEASPSFLIIGDLEQRFGGDLAYDLASPSSVDVVDVARKLGVGLAQAIDAFTVGARLDYRHKETELMLFGRAQIPEATVVTVDQKGFVEGGAAAAVMPIPGVYASAQYTLRQYQAPTEDADGDGVPDSQEMGSLFGSSGGSGLDRLQEIAVDAWMRSPKKNLWRIGAGAFYRIYDIVSPYATVAQDGRGGGRLDFQWWFSKQIHANIAGEVAEPSPTIQRELSTMTSVRAALEARW